MAGLYIHIPFCKQACYYCDFHFSTNQSTKPQLVSAIASELDLQKNYLEGDSINSIYFGGGTPSLLTHKELGFIFDSISNNFNIDVNAEITVEANPDDLSIKKLQELKSLGVNRLSIGIQSFNDDILKFLNRAHTSHGAVNCVSDARTAGFENISIDLIYAIPGQDDDAWKKMIHQAIALNPNHISSYALTIEDRTTFGNWLAKGKMKFIEDDIAACQLEILMDELMKEGFEQYEVSNFGKAGFYSRHNSNYWKEEKYLGVGPSAHSYNKHSRQFNVSNNYIYLKNLNKKIIPCEVESLTREDKINEYLLTTLRTSWGCDLEKLKSNFQYDVLHEHALYIESLFERNLGIVEGSLLKLTNAGKLLADKIASDLFLLRPGQTA
jgi:oxygen-independent coproporphyrinogen III oxidase